MTLRNKIGSQVASEGPGDVDDPEGYYYDADSRRNVVGHVCPLLFLVHRCLMMLSIGENISRWWWIMNEWVCSIGEVMLRRQSRNTRSEPALSATLSNTNPT